MYQFSIKVWSYFVIVLVHVRTHMPRDGQPIGELAAAAACLLAQAAGEMESGRMGGIPNAKEVS